MQVHRKRVGETDRHLPERVPRPRPLTQEDVAGILPIDILRRQWLPIAVQHLQVLPAQEGLIPTNFRELVFTQNGRRHRPGRVQGQPRYPGLQQRGLTFGTAHLRARLPHRYPVLIDDQLGRRDIHQQAGRLHVLSQPAKAFKVDAQLLAPRRRADVQLVQGSRPDHPVRLQRMAQLEIFHRIDQRGTVVRIDGNREAAQIALVQQPLCKLRHPLILHVRAQQRAAGKRLPVGQRLLALLGIHMTQVLILLQARAGLGKGPGNVLQPRTGERQHLGLSVALYLVGMPQGLETRLLQTAIVQILQSLQVLLADLDISTQRVARPIASRQRVVGRVQAIVGQALQLSVQGRHAPVDRPQRKALLLLIEGLQQRLRRRVHVLGQARARDRQLGER